MRHSDLKDRMDFDHVVSILPGGRIEDGPDGIHAPDLFCTDEEDYVREAEREGWSLLSGYTGQYGYSGVLLHSSEFIGGGLAEHILTNPGLYVAMVAECDPEECGCGWEEECECQSEEECTCACTCETEPAGWAVAFRPMIRPSGAYRCPCCGDDFYGTAYVCDECDGSGCEQTFNGSGEVGFWECDRTDTDDIPEITPADAGTWLDGSQGWHNSYRVVDRAESYGFTVPPEYTAALADYRENGPSASEDSWEAMCGHGELSDMATDYLQERAPEGYIFEWDMGEFSLIPESEADRF